MIKLFLLKVTTLLIAYFKQLKLSVKISKRKPSGQDVMLYVYKTLLLGLAPTISKRVLLYK